MPAARLLRRGCGVQHSKGDDGATVRPTGTVKFVNGKPVWNGDYCTECLACLHFCPQDASQHGKVTEGRKRYLNPAPGR